MSKPVTVDIFVEDRAHEEFLKPLLVRIANEEGVRVSVRPRMARGGHARALKEFDLYQRIVEKGGAGVAHPDLLIVAIDGNCSTFAKKRAEIEKSTASSLSGRLIVACPDPHVERWYLADPDSFVPLSGTDP